MRVIIYKCIGNNALTNSLIYAFCFFFRKEFLTICSCCSRFSTVISPEPTSSFVQPVGVHDRIFCMIPPHYRVKCLTGVLNSTIKSSDDELSTEVSCLQRGGVNVKVSLMLPCCIPIVTKSDSQTVLLAYKTE